MKENIKPISPDNIVHSIEPEIIQAVNELIIEKFIKDDVCIKVNEILKRYFKIKNIKSTATKRDSLFDRVQLDIEIEFEKQGWKVEFNSPDRDENFDSYFLFKKGKPKESVVNTKNNWNYRLLKYNYIKFCQGTEDKYVEYALIYAPSDASFANVRSTLINEKHDEDNHKIDIESVQDLTIKW